MSEDRRLPEASLDDGGAAELSGLESAHKRRLESFRTTRYISEITHLIQSVQHLDGHLPVDTGISDADTILEPRRT